MREIKFRVWSNTLKQMLNHNECKFTYNNGKITNVDSTLFSLTSFSQDYILEQYTGLKDKNGVEIYEGDKMNFGPFNVNVYWNDKITGYYMKFEFDKYDMPLNYRTKEFEVIGNIHTEEKE